MDHTKPQILVYVIPYLLYPPLQQSWKGGILVSPCPGGGWGGGWGVGGGGVGGLSSERRRSSCSSYIAKFQVNNDDSLL